VGSRLLRRGWARSSRRTLVAGAGILGQNAPLIRGPVVAFVVAVRLAAGKTPRMRSSVCGSRMLWYRLTFGVPITVEIRRGHIEIGQFVWHQKRDIDALVRNPGLFHAGH
jgi:hypothetical protein